MSINFERKKEQLLTDGYLLTQKVAQAIASTKSLSINLPEIFSRKNIKLQRANYYELFHEFVEYDKNVSQFIPIFDAPSPVPAGEYATFFSTYSSQLCQPRDNLRALLKDYRDLISSLDNDANNRLTMGGMFASILVAVVSLIVSAFALKLSLTQTDITIRQDETNRLLFSKAAKLELASKINGNTLVGASGNKTIAGDSGNKSISTMNIELQAYNTGTKSPSQGFYYQILIPTNIIEPSDKVGDRSFFEISKVETFTIDGKQYTRFGGFRTDPIFPGRRLTIGTISLIRPTIDFDLQWHFTTEDGAFPKENEYGRMPFRIKDFIAGATKD